MCIRDRYELAPGFIIDVTVKEGKIYGQPTGQPQVELFAESEDNFFLKVVEATTVFIRDEDGTVASMILNQNGRAMPGVKVEDATHAEMNTAKGMSTDQDVVEEREEVVLSAEKLKEYVGKYELTPSFVIEITTKGEKIYAQATGQQRFEIFPESEDAFYLKAVEARTVFTRGEDGTVKSMTLFQNGQEVPGVKMK